MSTRTTTEHERAERRRADRERMEQAAQALLSSEGWQRWVRVRSTNGLSRYSFHNQLLIAMQRPDATYVAGFRAFLTLNRCVRKGERAIRILAPMSVRGATPMRRVTAADGDEPQTRPHGLPRGRRVRRLPDRPPSRHGAGRSTRPAQPIEGDSHAHLLAPLEALAASSATRSHTAPSRAPRTAGATARNAQIVVNADLISANAQVRVLVHEIAHALGVGYERLRPPPRRGARRHRHVHRLRLGRPGHVRLERPLRRRLGRGRRAGRDPAATPRRSTRSRVASKTRSRDASPSVAPCDDRARGLTLTPVLEETGVLLLVTQAMPQMRESRPSEPGASRDAAPLLLAARARRLAVGGRQRLLRAV